jgi:hypothetical protein
MLFIVYYAGILLNDTRPIFSIEVSQRERGVEKRLLARSGCRGFQCNDTHQETIE